MLPWDKKFIENHKKIEPKTILCASEGLDVTKISRKIVRKLISSFDDKDYETLELESIASPNFYFLKKQEDKNIIPISDLREPKDFLNLSTGRNRLLFILGGEHIRLDGYNSLLKVSEEASESTFIFISTNNINSIPPTILSRFHVEKVPKPPKEEVHNYIVQKSENLSKNALNFLSENPLELQKSIDDALQKFNKFDEQIRNKNLISKDKDEIKSFIDYLVFYRKKEILTDAKKGFQTLNELIDIKKSLLAPNNLSIDVIKLRINSCL